MVESYICCGIKPTVVSSGTLDHAAGRRISSNGVVGLSTPRREAHALGNSPGTIELQSGRRISRLGVMGCSNFLTGGLKRAPGLGSSSATIRQPLSLRRVEAGNKTEDDREESVSGSEKTQKKSVDKKESFVESVEAELGRQFGGALWFGVLLFCLAVFGGGYAFLIINYADFSDIPILRGPQR